MDEVLVTTAGYLYINKYLYTRLQLSGFLLSHNPRRKTDGKFMLRESAMCPDDDKSAFEDITKHKFFNTNNLWISLS